jgi:hypothetical protein
LREICDRIAKHADWVTFYFATAKEALQV